MAASRGLAAQKCPGRSFWRPDRAIIARPIQRQSLSEGRPRRALECCDKSRIICAALGVDSGVRTVLRQCHAFFRITTFTFPQAFALLRGHHRMRESPRPWPPGASVVFIDGDSGEAKSPREKFGTTIATMAAARKMVADAIHSSWGRTLRLSAPAIQPCRQSEVTTKPGHRPGGPRRWS
jgi:hypothetical protein